MFSTMPKISTLTFSNIATLRLASFSATACGVVTTTAPAIGTVWARVNCTSPVPGGRSTSR